MAENFVMCVVGMAGTGKSTAVAYLEQRHGLDTVHFGAVVQAEVARRCLPPGPASEGLVREALRREHGPLVVVNRVAHSIGELVGSGRSVLADGVNTTDELGFLKGMFGSAVCVLAIHSSRLVRCQRLSNRPVRPIGTGEMDERDLSEMSLGKGPVIALADFHIVNDRGLEDLFADIDRAMEQARSQLFKSREGVMEAVESGE